MRSDHSSPKDPKTVNESVPYVGLPEPGSVIDSEQALVDVGASLPPAPAPVRRLPVEPFDPLQFRVRAELAADDELNGNFHARLSPEGLALRDGVVTVLTLPLDAPVRRLSDHRLAFTHEEREVTLEIVGWRTDRRRLARDLTQLFGGERSALNAKDYFTPAHLLLPIVPCLALPAVALGAPVWIGLGLALAAVCLLLAFRRELSVPTRAGLSWGTALVGFGLLGLSTVLPDKRNETTESGAAASNQPNITDAADSGRIAELEAARDKSDRERAAAQRALEDRKNEIEQARTSATDAERVAKEARAAEAAAEKARAREKRVADAARRAAGLVNLELAGRDDEIRRLQALTKAFGPMTPAEQAHREYVHKFLLAARAFKEENLPLARRLLDECPQSERGIEWRLLARSSVDSSKTLLRDESPFESVAFSPRGDLFASLGNGRIVIWDAKTHEKRATLAGRCAVAFSPDGKYVATADAKNNVLLYGQDLTKPELVLTGMPARVTTIQFAPSGKRVIAIGGGTNGLRPPETALRGAICVWDLPTLQPRFTFQSLPRLYSAAISSDGGFLAVGGVEGTIHFWSLRDFERLATIQAHEESVNGLAFTPDDDYLISGSGHHVRDVGQLKYWAIDGNRISLEQARDTHVRCLLVSPKGHWVITGGRDRALKWWSIPRALVLHKHHGHAAMPRDLAMDAKPSQMVSVTGSSLPGTAHRNELKSWTVYEPVPGPRSNPLTRGNVPFAVSADGARVALFNASTGVLVVTRLGAKRGNRLLRLTMKKNAGSAQRLALSADGELLAFSLPELGAVEVWNVKEKKQLTSLKMNVRVRVNELTFGPAGRFLAWTVHGAQSPVPFVVDVKTQKPVLKLNAKTPSHFFQSVAFNTDGKSVITSDEQGSVTRWTLADGKSETLVQTVAPIHRFSLSADGKRLATYRRGDSVRIWDVAKKRITQSLPTADEEFHLMEMDGSGTRLLTVNNRSQVKIWDTDTGLRLLTPAEYGHPVEFASVLGDGNSIGIVISVAHAKGLTFQPIPLDARPPK